MTGMDIETRQKICQLVAGIIISDDILDEKEEAFVDRLIKSFEVGESGREVIFPLVDRDEAAEQIKQLSKEAQDAAIGLLIEAACIDGQIAPEEREYLRAIGAALEVPETTLAKRVADQLAAVSPTT
jgi:uncharacterized tellurite resistance protein B-like protein